MFDEYPSKPTCFVRQRLHTCFPDFLSVKPDIIIDKDSSNSFVQTVIRSVSALEMLRNRAIQIDNYLHTYLLTYLHSNLERNFMASLSQQRETVTIQKIDPR